MKKTIRRVGLRGAAYINRKSQITKKPPTKRLKSRRTKVVAKRVRGYFPNPNKSIWKPRPMQCPFCTRAADAPYRGRDSSGKIVQGCVSEYHSGHLTPGTETANFHNSPAGKKIRSMYRKHMAELFKKAVRKT